MCLISNEIFGISDFEGEVDGNFPDEFSGQATDEAVVEDQDDEEFWPLKKVLAAKRTSKSLKIKNVRRPESNRQKDNKMDKNFKEKENRQLSAQTIKREETEARLFQKSFAKRVPVQDPLDGSSTELKDVPPDVKKVKLIISARKRKLDTEVLEPITQLKEVDSNSLEPSSTNEPSKKKKRKGKLEPLPEASRRLDVML